jgi:iron complex transport system ATP-binding protein
MLLTVKNVCVPKPQQHRGEDKFFLVDNVNCSVDSGEVLAIIGPNGAGKSSLIRAICGDWPYHGEINIHGLAERPVERARQIAVLPQLNLLTFGFRVSEVVNLGRIPHRTGAVCDRRIVQDALEMMDIGFLRDRLYPELSGGEKQRVQLARVLAQIWRAEDAPNGTRLLLLDEPTAALDLGHQQDLIKAVKQFSQQGVSVVMVLHDVNLAARNADKLLAMICSETLAYGSVSQVVTAENMKKLFNIATRIVPHPVYGTPVVIPE